MIKLIDVLTTEELKSYTDYKASQLVDANQLNEQELMELAQEYMINNEMELMEQTISHMVSCGFDRDEIILDLIEGVQAI